MISIGLDIANDKIDFYSDGKHAVFGNNRASIRSHFRGIDKKSRIVMEATGSYHRVAHRTLEEMGFSVMVVNPYQSKHFAKAMNVVCKTDAVKIIDKEIKNRAAMERKRSKNCLTALIEASPAKAASLYKSLYGTPHQVRNDAEPCEMIENNLCNNAS